MNAPLGAASLRSYASVPSITSMKFLKLLITICAAHVFVATASAQTKPKTNQLGYAGPVASVRTYTVSYWFEYGKLRHGKRKLNSIKRFDMAGHLIQEHVLTYTDTILYQYQYVYDSRARCIEAFGTHDKFVYLPDRRVYIYDPAGNLVTENGFDSQGKLYNKHEYAYDDKRRRIRSTSISYHPEEPHRPHQWTYEYYENGLVKNERAFVDEGGVFQPTDTLGGAHRKFFLYNSANKPATVLLYDASGEFAGMVSTVYDSRENKLEEIQYDSTGGLKDKTKYSYRYDKFGNYVIQKIYRWDAKTGAYHLTEIRYHLFKYRK